MEIMAIPLKLEVEIEVYFLYLHVPPPLHFWAIVDQKTHGQPSYFGDTRFYFFFHIWECPEMGVPQNGWFTRENPIVRNDN